MVPYRHELQKHGIIQYIKIMKASRGQLNGVKIMGKKLCV